jgi:hypothetical protein
VVDVVVSARRSRAKSGVAKCFWSDGQPPRLGGSCRPYVSVEMNGMYIAMLKPFKAERLELAEYECRHHLLI